jgi:hypothetical protein
MWDIFLYDSSRPKLKRLTLTSEGGERDQGSESISRVVAPSISGNGQVVAFATTAANMVPGDNNKMQDVFVVNTVTGRVNRVSTGQNGVEGNGDSPAGQGEKIAISQDGTAVAFSTSATNLGGSIILKINNWTETVVISDGSRAAGPPSISFGGYVIFGSGDRLDGRFPSSGIFARSTGLYPCRFCIKQRPQPTP